MGKLKCNITNWKQYNQALVNRGSVTFWLDDAAINTWHCRSITAVVVNTEGCYEVNSQIHRL
jgi:hypothetical protein